MDDDDTTTTTLNPYNDCNWSDLHEDLLELILKEVSTATVADCLRFGSVCVSWRSALVPHFHPDLLHPQLPLLMIPSLPWPQSPSPSPPNNTIEKDDDNNKREETRSLYSLSERRVISEEDLKIKLPYNRNCRGSNYGWILVTPGNEDTGFSVELINPFISINNEYQKIQLPPLTAFPYDPDTEILNYAYFEKAILSANPTTTTDYVVMAIYGNGQLGFWKPGNEVWTNIPIEWRSRCPLDDVIYHHNNRLFYLVNIHGEVMVCDFYNGGATVRRFAPPPMLNEYGGLKKYLVESLGDLLMLHKYESTRNFSRFMVFKLRGGEEEKEEVVIKGPLAAEWKIIDTLPDRMLFVGDNTSMSLSASELIGGKSGCIYFTDDDPFKGFMGFSDIGIYNMKDRTTEKLLPMGSNDYISPVNTIWVAPALRCCLRF